MTRPFATRVRDVTPGFKNVKQCLHNALFCSRGMRSRMDCESLNASLTALRASVVLPGVCCAASASSAWSSVSPLRCLRSRCVGFGIGVRREAVINAYRFALV